MRLLEVRSAVKEFGSLTAVDRVSLTVESGEIVGLLGANGAGKTTLIRMILGLLTATSGEIEILDQPVWEVNRNEIGYVPQGLGLYADLTVAENLQFVSSAFGVPFPDLGSSMSQVANTRIGDVSLGLRRRTAFAAAVSHDPSILILDEPTSGVGPLGRAGLWEMIHGAAEDGAGVLVTTHHMEEAEECDRVVVLAAGREVASGRVSEIVGAHKSVAISGVGQEDVEKLRGNGMTLLADGRDWRVLGADVGRIRELLPHATVKTVPASFEEAFFELSR